MAPSKVPCTLCSLPFFGKQVKTHCSGTCNKYFHAVCIAKVKNISLDNYLKYKPIYPCDNCEYTYNLNNCGFCNKRINKRQVKLFCTGNCKRPFHSICTGLGDTEITKIMDENIYVCRECILMVSQTNKSDKTVPVLNKAKKDGPPSSTKVENDSSIKVKLPSDTVSNDNFNPTGNSDNLGNIVNMFKQFLVNFENRLKNIENYIFELKCDKITENKNRSYDSQLMTSCNCQLNFKSVDNNKGEAFPSKKKKSTALDTNYSTPKGTRKEPTKINTQTFVNSDKIKKRNLTSVMSNTNSFQTKNLTISNETEKKSKIRIKPKEFIEENLNSTIQLPQSNEIFVPAYNNKYSAVFISRFQNLTHSSDIKEYLHHRLSDKISFKVFKLQTRFLSYSSFCILIDKNLSHIILSKSFWPKHSLICKFKGILFKNKIINEYSCIKPNRFLSVREKFNNNKRNFNEYYRNVHENKQGKDFNLSNKQNVTITENNDFILKKFSPNLSSEFNPFPSLMGKQKVNKDYENISGNKFYEQETDNSQTIINLKNYINCEEYLNGEANTLEESDSDLEYCNSFIDTNPSLTKIKSRDFLMSGKLYKNLIMNEEVNTPQKVYKFKSKINKLADTKSVTYDSDLIDLSDLSEVNRFNKNEGCEGEEEVKVQSIDKNEGSEGEDEEEYFSSESKGFVDLTNYLDMEPSMAVNKEI